MKRLQAERDMASIVISHDLAVVKYLADRIGVMYLGKLVELGSGDDIYLRAGPPLHRGADQDDPAARPGGRARQEDAGIRGELPSPVNPPSGCRFRTRCPRAKDICADRGAAAALVRPGPQAACHFPLQDPTADGQVAQTAGSSSASPSSSSSSSSST